MLEPLGQGGMGVVYRARHSVTERAVAVKTVRVPAPRWIESIRREIDALTRIRHPGIVRIVDHGVHEGRPWYAMDLLEGESLRDFSVRIWSPYRTPSAPAGPIRPLTITEPVSQTTDEVEASRPTPPPRPHVGDAPAAAGALSQVLGLMRRLCATLAFLHGEGIVSCDLKPENIVLVGSTPVLIDFGLSRRFPASTGREEMDAQRSMAGTLPYMSPEQSRGELVDARSDLYAVGCILYELLTGAPPFTGAPYTIRMLHQTAAPTPPSQIVRDLPPALEAVVLRLLEKAPNDRVGFADEVALALAEIGGDNQRLHDFPPARPYLYRPRFVGRVGTLATLGALRDAACAGYGAMALIAGESGVGKTRLALELTRLSASSGLRVIASESLPVAPEHVPNATATAAPLHIIRPLLRAIADRCQEGGAETTDRLLGVRRSVLALYEPLLAEVPSGEPLSSVVPLAPDASRQRLLRYVAQSLTALAQEQPVLWILDDVGWADDLSLAFLESLTADYFAVTPALLVGTYRSEEATDMVRAVARLSHVTHLKLSRLEDHEVSAMVSDMLAAPVAHASFAAYVAEAAEGNPFFVTEHVRTAVNERLFYRDQDHTWRLRATETDGQTDYRNLPLPRSLRALVEHRLRSLSDLAQGAARAAGVLGREFPADIIAEVAALSPEAAAAAMNELVRRQVLEQPNPEHLRFVHDKLREVAYGGPAEILRTIHGRAAVALERRWADDAGRWAVLGHHFAAAHRPEAAAQYLNRAAQHARANHAIADAIVLYRRAIDQVREVMLGALSDTPSWQSMLLEMREALGDALALGASREEARVEFMEALKQKDDGVRIARLHRKLGKTWEGSGDHELALEHYARARSTMPALPEATELEAWDEWFLTRFDELRVNYWLAREREMDSLVTELQPVIEKLGTPQQLAGFYQSQIFYRLGRERYVVSDETLSLSEMVVRVCGKEGEPERAWAHFQRGFTLLLSRPTDEATRYLNTALRLALRAGDLVTQARAALYVAVAARMAGRVDDVPSLAVQAATIAREAGMRQYAAAAKATEAWLCVRHGDVQGTLRLSGEAISEWSSYRGVYPFHWLALIPRLEAQLSLNLLDDAMQSCKSLLVPEQRQLPSVAEESLNDAIVAWNAGDERVTRSRLNDALQALADHSLR